MVTATKYDACPQCRSTEIVYDDERSTYYCDACNYTLESPLVACNRCGKQVQTHEAHGDSGLEWAFCSLACYAGTTTVAEVRAALDALDRHATVLREFGRDVYLSASAIREVGSEIETQLAILRAALRAVVK